MDPVVRRALMRPLARRRSSPATRRLLQTALDQLETRAFAAALLPELVQLHKAARANRSSGSARDPAVAKLSADFASAMLFAKRISRQEYTFFVSAAAEEVHDRRLVDRAYPEIAKISDRIRAVEKAHGLKIGQYWPIGEGPLEYRELNAEFDREADSRFIETLRELEANDLAVLYADNRQEFERLRERGRRSVFHKDEMAAVLTDIVVRYEREARFAAAAEAYTAAITLLGAASEGLLLLRCIRSKKKAVAVAATLPKAKRPRVLDNLSQWTFDTLIEVCLKAGWLPTVSTNSTTIRPDDLAHHLRQMRNNIHPGRIASQRPWIEVEDGDYALAEVIYTTMFATVSRGKHLRRMKEIAQSSPQIPRQFL